MEILFWSSIILVSYCYFGYPLLVALAARLCPHPVRKADYPASVSFVLSVYNEADVLRAKLENILSLQYPAGEVEILIGSDGSTDQTNEIVKGFTDTRLRFFPSTERRGKMATINDLVAKAQNEIVIFTDARQIFAPDAVVELVKNFADPQVGCVSGELMFTTQKGGGTAQGINFYWTYEKFLRRREAHLHSMLGATGAIYAIRRTLYAPVPADVVLDDVYIPFKIIAAGYRAIFDEAALAYDEVADSPREEHRRKARTLYGNYQIFALFPGFLNPLASPIAIQLFSHKFLRVVAPFLLILALGANALLVGQPAYTRFFLLQIVFYIMAMIGGLARHCKCGMLKGLLRLCYVPYVFCLLNFSALAGFLRFFRRQQRATWDKAREG